MGGWHLHLANLAPYIQGRWNGEHISLAFPAFHERL